MFSTCLLLKFQWIAKLNVYVALYGIVNEKNTKYASTFHGERVSFTDRTRDEYYMSVKAPAAVPGYTRRASTYVGIIRCRVISLGQVR